MRENKWATYENESRGFRNTVGERRESPLLRSPRAACPRTNGMVAVAVVVRVGSKRQFWPDREKELSMEAAMTNLRVAEWYQRHR